MNSSARPPAPRRLGFARLLLAVGWLSAVVLARATNLVPFADFESGNLAAWSETGSATISSADVHGGQFSARMTTGDLRAVFATTAATTYKVSGWLRITAETGSDWGGFRVAVGNYADWQELAHSGYFLTATHGGAWFKFSFNFTAVAAQSRLQIGYFGGGGRAMTVFIDDVAVEPFDANQPPVISAATLTPNSVGTLPATQAFSVTASDPDGAVRRIAWDFGDGGRAQTASGTRRVVGPGNFTARVTVTDDDGARTTLDVPWSAADPAWPGLEISFPFTDLTVATPSLLIAGSATNTTGAVTASSDRGAFATFVVAGGAWSGQVALEAGWNRVLVQARDTAGHVTTRERRVRYVPSAPLAVSGLPAAPPSVARWDVLEIPFDLTGSAATHRQHPFAAERPPGVEFVDGVSVDAVFSPDNFATTFRRPAFWRQPYARARVAGQEWMEPQGPARWVVRFAPPTTGTWSYRVEVAEAKGTAQSAVQTFTVTAAAATNHGPVRVSPTDPRYFEHADGTPFLGTGHNSGFDADAYSYGFADDLAAMGAGNQQLLRVWIGGHLWGSAWQPWASRTLGYDGTVPSTGLALAAAYGDGLAAWRLDAANPIQFQGFMSGRAALVPGANYRVFVRWRTEGVAGPATTGAPHGVCLKFTGWPEPGQTGALPVLVPHVAGDAPWHVASADFTATGDFLPNLAAILENTTAGAAYLDEIRVHRVLAGGVLGPQLLRGPRANLHLDFDPRRGAGLDAALAAAEAADLHLRLVISEKDEWLLEHLGHDGLPDPNGEQFFAPTGSAGRWLHESYWRHLFARLGASRAVHSWELVNEAAPGNGPPFTLAARLAALARADGNPHPASLSTWATLAAAAWTHADNAAIDHADFHCYVRGTGWLGPVEELAADSARFFHDYDEAVRAAALGRPVVWGEQGIDTPASTDGEEPLLAQDATGVWLHKLTWARCGPGGVYPLYWWQQNIVAHGLHGRFGAWRRFMAGVPLANGRYADAAATTSHADLRVFGQKDLFNGRAHLWIDHRRHTWRAVVDGTPVAPVSGTVQLDLGRPNARVQAQWWNPTTGAPTTSEQLVANGSGVVTLTLASLATDTAVQLVAENIVVPPAGGDWPQLQRDAARTGRVADAIAPPFRARWIWAGPGVTLRNRDSVAGWPDDLRARSGYTYPNLPVNSGVTLAQSVQPVVAGGRLFVGTMEGYAFALGADDGANLWQTALPGPVVSTAAVAADVVVFACATGEVVGLGVADGAERWRFDTGRAITGAPAVVGARVFVGNHAGRVFALTAATGVPAWQTAPLGPGIHGGLCADAQRVYVGTENMAVHALDAATGATLASTTVRGQSFRFLWPVLAAGRVWVSSVPTPLVGSEYVGEANAGSQLFADGATLGAEETNLLRWLDGDTNGGRWPDAGRDWQRLFALDPTTLAQPFVVAAGPADGVGLPPAPPVVDHAGRVLTYFKTRHPRLTAANGTVFGTAYSVDIAGVDPATGLRQPIDVGRLAQPWPWETDNLYGLATAGTQLWLRQNFRGTQVIDLATATARGVSAEVRNRDGGTFNFDVVYKDAGSPVATPQRPLLGRTPPAIVGGRVFIAEDWGITAIEHAP